MNCASVWLNVYCLIAFMSFSKVSPSDVVELEPEELVVQAPNLIAVGFHLRAAAVGVLHDLVDDELRVTTGVEASDP